MRRFSQIVYCSRSNVTGKRADVEVQIRSILATARRNNKAAGLTGALTFNPSCFVQVLEGYDDDLQPVFEQIRRDRRHRDLKILASSEPAQRMFPCWSMAYVRMPHDDGRHPLAHFEFEAALTEGRPPQAQKLLEALRQLTMKIA